MEKCRFEVGHCCVRVWCVNKWFLLLCRVFRWRRGLWQSVTSTLIALPVWQWRTHTAVGVFLTAGEFHLVIPALDCSFQFILGVFLSVCQLSYSSSCLVCFLLAPPGVGCVQIVGWARSKVTGCGVLMSSSSAWEWSHWANITPALESRNRYKVIQSEIVIKWEI